MRSEKWTQAIKKAFGSENIPSLSFFEDIDFPLLSDNVEGEVAGFVESGMPSKKPIMYAETVASDILNIWELSDAGAYAWLEIAYALYQIKHSDKEKLDFCIGISDSFYIQTAKFTALRALATQLRDSPRITVSAKPVSYNKFKTDPETNLIRATSEYMAAVIGGVDILVGSGDLLPDQDESLRLSKNMVLLLINESDLRHSYNYWLGSYSISGVAYSVAEKAWLKFLELDNLPYGEATENVLNLAEEHMKSREMKNKDLSHVRIGFNKYQPISKEVVR